MAILTHQFKIVVVVVEIVTIYMMGIEWYREINPSSAITPFAFVSAREYQISTNGLACYGYIIRDLIFEFTYRNTLATETRSGRMPQLCSTRTTRLWVLALVMAYSRIIIRSRARLRTEIVPAIIILYRSVAFLTSFWRLVVRRYVNKTFDMRRFYGFRLPKFAEIAHVFRVTSSHNVHIELAC